jgi:hypothetical protein
MRRFRDETGRAGAQQVIAWVALARHPATG